MSYINIHDLFRCETCHHHKNGKCDTWCEVGESYRPAMSALPVHDVVSRQEYARKIFADINKLLDAYLLEGMCTSEFEELFAELQKKYTED